MIRATLSYRHMWYYTGASTVQERKRNLLTFKLLLVFGEYSSSSSHDSLCCPSSEVGNHYCSLSLPVPLLQISLNCSPRLTGQRDIFPNKTRLFVNGIWLQIDSEGKHLEAG